MAKNGHFTERAITTAQDYLEGFMEEGEEELACSCELDSFIRFQHLMCVEITVRLFDI